MSTHMDIFMDMPTDISISTATLIKTLTAKAHYKRHCNMMNMRCNRCCNDCRDCCDNRCSRCGDRLQRWSWPSIQHGYNCRINLSQLQP